jgi:hypothetical protein
VCRQGIDPFREDTQLHLDGSNALPNVSYITSDFAQVPAYELHVGFENGDSRIREAVHLKTLGTVGRLLIGRLHVALPLVDNKFSWNRTLSSFRYL